MQNELPRILWQSLLFIHKKWFATQTNPQQHQNDWQKKLPSCHNNTWTNNNNNNDKKKKRQIEEPDEDDEPQYDNNVNEKNPSNNTKQQ